MGKCELFFGISSDTQHKETRVFEKKKYPNLQKRLLKGILIFLLSCVIHVFEYAESQDMYFIIERHVFYKLHRIY